MKKISLSVCQILILMITACSNQDPAPLPTDKMAMTETNVSVQTIEPTQAITLLPSQTNTLTQTSTWTPRPTRITPTPTPSSTSTSYPFFELSEMETRTPSPPTECPRENSDIQLSFDSIIDNDPGYYTDIIQQAFDDGATIQQVAQELNEIFDDKYDTEGYFPVVDLTGDEVEELVVYQIFNTVIYGCNSGEYKVLLDYRGIELIAMTELHIVAIDDMNANGVPDIVFAYPVTTGWNTVADILEWNGTEFVSLIQANHGENSPRTSRFARVLYWYESDWYDGNFLEISTPIMNNGADVEVRDIDGNSTKELVLTDSGPAHPDTVYSFGPWRGKKVVFSWNGIEYLYSDLKMDTPEYRFQAVQDADRLFLLNRYDEALSLYQDAIFSGDLEWWTGERRDYIRDVQWGKEDIIEPEPNPNEYPSLEAYARYRIIVHHVASGWLEEAEIAYTKLLEKFPYGTVGHEFTELAILFWNEYTLSNNFEMACIPVVEYVESNQEMLGLLGNLDHGLQSHHYVPEDLCPFP